MHQFHNDPSTSIHHLSPEARPEETELYFCGGGDDLQYVANKAAIKRRMTATTNWKN
jgi:hypothetical protein